MILLILVIILLTYCSYKHFSDYDNVGAILILVVGIFLYFFITVYLHSIIPQVKSELVVLENQKLISISDNFGIEGDLFLGSGKIRTKPIYATYFKEGKGIKLKIIPEEGLDGADVFIKEDSEKNAIYCTIEYDKKYISWIFTILLVPEFIADTLSPSFRYVIHVPQGTIKPKIKLQN